MFKSLLVNSAISNIGRDEHAYAANKALKRTAGSLALVAALIVCWRAAEIRPTALFGPGSSAALWAFVRSLFPPDFSPAFLRVVGAAIVRTAAIAIAGTSAAIVIGLPLGVLSTPSLWQRGLLLAGEPPGLAKLAVAWFSRGCRALLGFMRAVPDLMWALIFVVAVGLGPIAGVLALAVSYGGLLGRIYADVFEDVDSRALEAIHATGATRLQVFLLAIWPQAQPGIVSYTLYLLECCARSASVLGFIGAGGIGYEINLSMRLFSYDQLLTLILALVGLVAATDLFSRYVRGGLRANARTGVLKRQNPPQSASTQPNSSSHPNRRPLAFWLVLVAAVLASFYLCGFFGGSYSGMFGRMSRFASAMFPQDLTPKFIRSLGVPLLQTIGISVMGTLIGIAIGALLALPAASNIVFVNEDEPGRRSPLGRAIRASFYYGSRLLLNLLRSIPELVWVLICILAIGLGPFAGTLAIGLHTGGVLGKLYAETLEEVPVPAVNALRAAGGRLMQILVWGIWPQARPTLVSYTVLRWEMNLRVSTILGLVGGGGLGQAIYNNVQLGFYSRTITIIAIVYGLVIIVDWLGDKLRSRQTPIYG